MLKELQELIIDNKTQNNIYGFKNYYGVKVQDLRKIAKIIAKEKRYEFFDDKHKCFEEIMIHAFSIGYTKEDISIQLKFIRQFIPLIDNWAINDALCQNMKFARKHPKEVFNFLSSMKDSKNEWEIRVIAVTLLSHFINDEYIDDVIELLDYIKKETYMAKMGVAWAIATIMAKYPTKTYDYLSRCSLDNWTYNKAIQKMLESYRVSKEDKEKLKTMKRK